MIVRTVSVPPPVAIPILRDGQPATHEVSFAEFVLFLVAGDTRFNHSGGGIRASVRVETAIKGAPVKLEPADWQLLRDVAEQPDCGHMTLSNGRPIGRLFLSFIDAIAAAKEEVADV